MRFDEIVHLADGQVEIVVHDHHRPQLPRGVGLPGRLGQPVGHDVVEITPSRDVNDMTSLVAGKFITNFIGTAVRAGYFG